MRKERKVLKDEADAAPVGLDRKERAAVDQDVAAVGASKPARMRMSVDLPAPLAPRIVTYSPASAAKLTERRTGLPS